MTTRLAWRPDAAVRGAPTRSSMSGLSRRPGDGREARGDRRYGPTVHRASHSGPEISRERAFVYGVANRSEDQMALFRRSLRLCVATKPSTAMSRIGSAVASL